MYKQKSLNKSLRSLKKEYVNLLEMSGEQQVLIPIANGHTSVSTKSKRFSILTADNLSEKTPLKPRHVRTALSPSFKHDGK